MGPCYGARACCGFAFVKARVRARAGTAVCTDARGSVPEPAAFYNAGWPCISILWICALRSEEHTSELQSQSNLVCRLLLEKKNFPETERLSQEKPLSLIHAFNDPIVMAWPGTISLQIHQQKSDFEGVLVPVECGGYTSKIG